jgi:hypothetical protein
VSVKNTLGKILLIATLGVGSLMGVPMTPEEIEELLYRMSQPKIEDVVKASPVLGILLYPGLQ